MYIIWDFNKQHLYYCKSFNYWDYSVDYEVARDNSLFADISHFDNIISNIILYSIENNVFKQWKMKENDS